MVLVPAPFLHPLRKLKFDDHELAITQPQKLTQPITTNYHNGRYTQPISSSHLAMQNNQMAVGSHPHPGSMYPQMQSGYIYYTQYQYMYGDEMARYGYGPTYGNGQSQPQNGQFLEQSMSGQSVRDNSMLMNSSCPVSYVSSGKPSKPMDKLFG